MPTSRRMRAPSVSRVKSASRGAKAPFRSVPLITSTHVDDALQRTVCDLIPIVSVARMRALGSLVTTKFKAAWSTERSTCAKFAGGASPPAALRSTIPTVDIRTSPDPNLARPLLASLMLRHPGAPSPEQRTPVRLVAPAQVGALPPPLWRAHPDLRRQPQAGHALDMSRRSERAAVFCAGQRSGDFCPHRL